MIGTLGRFFEARLAVDPVREKQTIAFAAIVFEICLAATITASVGVLSCSNMFASK